MTSGQIAGTENKAEKHHFSSKFEGAKTGAIGHPVRKRVAGSVSKFDRVKRTEVSRNHNGTDLKLLWWTFFIGLIKHRNRLQIIFSKIV